MRISERDLATLRAAPIAEVVRHYGLTPNRAGFCRCPFHGGGRERTASMKLYTAEESRWHCFGCHKGGDTIAFVMEMEGVDFPAAAVRVNEICGLGLALDRKETPEERRRRLRQEAERREQREVAERFREWEAAFYARLAACCLKGNRALAVGPPWDPQEVEAVKRLAELDALADTLNSGTEQERVDVFRRRADYMRLFRAIEGGTTAAAG